MAAQISYSTVVYIDKTLYSDVSAHNGALQGLKNLHGLVTDKPAGWLFQFRSFELSCPSFFVYLRDISVCLLLKLCLKGSKFSGTENAKYFRLLLNGNSGKKVFLLCMKNC